MKIVKSHNQFIFFFHFFFFNFSKLSRNVEKIITKLKKVPDPQNEPTLQSFHRSKMNLLH